MRETTQLRPLMRPDRRAAGGARALVAAASSEFLGRGKVAVDVDGRGGASERVVKVLQRGDETVRVEDPLTRCTSSCS